MHHITQSLRRKNIQLSSRMIAGSSRSSFSLLQNNVAIPFRTTNLYNSTATTSSSSSQSNTANMNNSHVDTNPLETSSGSSSSNSSSTQQETTDELFEDPREAILLGALKHVGREGWTAEALAAGAQEAGYPAVSAGMFEKGPVELVWYVMQKGNEHMSYALEAHTPELATLDMNARIAAGVKARLEYHMSKYAGNWAQAMALGAHPQHLQQTLHHLAVLVDEIWYWAGDRSVNMHWYSRRLLLLGVYAATETFMLTDTSVGYADTWAFLDRRLAEVTTFGRISGENLVVAQSILSGMGSVVGAGLEMGKPFIAPGQHVLKFSAAKTAMNNSNMNVKSSSSSSGGSAGNSDPLGTVAAVAQQMTTAATSVAAAAGIRLPDPVQVISVLGSLLPQPPRK